MTTAVQVQFRRGDQSQMASFTGAAGEMNVDTTNNRVVVQDGTTAGGFAAAKLAEIAGGFLNKFRNGTMDVWQRGTAPALTVGTSGAQYTADGWIVGWTASASAAPAIAQAGGRLLTKNSLQVIGAANLTDVYVKQRIESLIAAAFCSQTVTVQARVYNNTGASITPALTVNRPSAQDNYASVTADVNAVALQGCANGAWTQIAYTFAANAASYNGLEIIFDFGNSLGVNTKTLQIAECDIRVTNGFSLGLNANPPAIELRPMATELLYCQRYYQVVNPAPSQFSLSNVSITGTTSFKMYGYGTSMTFTPRQTGVVLIFGAFRAVGTSVSQSSGDDYAVYYGTGSAPANGASATGTNAFSISCSTPSGVPTYYPMLGMAAGLTVGTPYWFDIAGLVGASTATMNLLGPVFLFVELGPTFPLLSL